MARPPSPPGYSFAVRDSGPLLHLERIVTPGRTVCNRRCRKWPEKPASAWAESTGQRCQQCERPLGPNAVLKP